MLDELFSKLPNAIQAAIIAATFLWLMISGKNIFTQRKSYEADGPSIPVFVSAIERLERVSNDRFDRIDRCLEGMEADTKTGFERIERALSDLGKDVVAVRSRRKT